MPTALQETLATVVDPKAHAQDVLGDLSQAQ